MTSFEHGAPHAGAVRARARVARRALFLSRVGEAVCLGSAVALLALAAVLLEGGRTDRLGSGAVAMLCFALVSLTWLVEHRRTAREVAQRLDRKLGANGEFLTAWEQDGERRGGPLAEVLVERAARHVPGRVAARAALPKSGPILALPFLAGAVLAALAGRPDPAEVTRLAGRMRLASDLGRLAGEEAAAALSNEEQRELRELVRSARALAETAGREADESADLAAELRELEERLPAGSRLAEGLGELAGRLSAANGASESDSTAGKRAAQPGETGTGGPALAPGAMDGTMVPRDTRPEGSVQAPRGAESAWIDPGSLPPDLARILDDWDAVPPATLVADDDMSTAQDDRTADPESVGLWLVGARGAISTCLAYGLAGICEGLLEPVGLCTEQEPIAGLPLVPLENLVLGGHDVCTRSLTDSAAELVQHGVLPAWLVERTTSRASTFEGRIRPGTLDGPDVGGLDLDPRSAELGARSPREQVERIQQDLADFKESHGLSRVVVVNVSSTEAARDKQPEWDDLDAFESALDNGLSQPASLLYAYAALSAGCPHVNFTPNRGASLPALRRLAESKGVPHCGNDGKTGETLVKTVLGPMFRARALRVLSWQGYNMLGNRDGEVLRVDTHKENKLANKDEALRSILGDPNTHTHVGIDYVPSLADWKTAWDYVHFEGFLGARMSLQFTWSGSDSALAAPLVLDLVRLAELAARRGEVGEMPHTACFFKAPLSGGTHDFHLQYQRLLEYADTLRQPGKPS